MISTSFNQSPQLRLSTSSGGILWGAPAGVGCLGVGFQNTKEHEAPSLERALDLPQLFISDFKSAAVWRSCLKGCTKQIDSGIVIVASLESASICSKMN